MTTVHITFQRVNQFNTVRSLLFLLHEFFSNDKKEGYELTQNFLLNKKMNKVYLPKCTKNYGEIIETIYVVIPFKTSKTIQKRLFYIF